MRSSGMPRSTPAQKARPSARTITTRTPGAKRISSALAPSWRADSQLQALSLSGRVKTTVAIGPSISSPTYCSRSLIGGLLAGIAILRRARASGLEGSLAHLLADRDELGLEHGAALPVGAVDDERVAGDVGGEGRGEEGGGPAELARVADAPRGRAGVLALPALRHRADRRHLVLVREEPGDEAVHADPVGRPLDGERLRQVLDPGLRGRAVREAGAARPGVGGADVDDRAGGAGGDVPASELARAHEGAVQ